MYIKKTLRELAHFASLQCETWNGVGHDYAVGQVWPTFRRTPGTLGVVVETIEEDGAILLNMVPIMFEETLADRRTLLVRNDRGHAMCALLEFETTMCEGEVNHEQCLGKLGDDALAVIVGARSAGKKTRHRQYVWGQSIRPYEDSIQDAYHRLLMSDIERLQCSAIVRIYRDDDHLSTV